MEYALLTNQDRDQILLGRIHELEAHHYKLRLEEDEEPGESAARAASIADLERRISEYHRGLDNRRKMTGDSPEREDDAVPEP